VLLRTACGFAALPDLAGGLEAYGESLCLQEILIQFDQLSVYRLTTAQPLQCASHAVFIALLRGISGMTFLDTRMIRRSGFSHSLCDTMFHGGSVRCLFLVCVHVFSRV
jgi:hypothetical protein